LCKHFENRRIFERRRAISEKSFLRQTRRETQYTVMSPAAELGLVKSVYVGAVPAVKTVVVPAAPVAAAPAQGTGQATAIADTVG